MAEARPNLLVFYDPFLHFLHDFQARVGFMHSQHELDHLVLFLEVPLSPQHA